MKADETERLERAEALRREFDRSFAVPRDATAEAEVDLLAIRAGGASYAVRLSEVAALYTDRPVTPVPSPVRELRGIAELRGALVAVWDLSALLGGAPSGSDRWQIVIAGGEAVAVSFEAFEGHVRVAESAVSRAGGSTAEGETAGEVVTTPSGPRPILGLLEMRRRLEAKAQAVGT